jgi:hypothetical protein
MRLRLKSLQAILEHNKYLRKSLKGLREDHPEIFAMLKDAYTQVESYQLLELLVNKEGLMDEKYMIYVKHGELPHIFEIKPSYSQAEIFAFSKKTGIPVATFEEIAAETAA